MGKRRKLSTEITIWMTMTSVCAMLLLGMALLVTFLYYSSEKAKEDMEYILTTTNGQFQNKVQFVQDGAIALRQSLVLRDFFEKNSYKEDEMEKQLHYSMDLFSERNLIMQSRPFIESVYLFNNRDQFIKEHYYPITVRNGMVMDAWYQQMFLEFKESSRQYRFVSEKDKLNLCLRIYNDQMRQMGVCIVVINEEAVEYLFGELFEYEGAKWAVFDEAGELLSSAQESGDLWQEMPRTEYLGKMKIGGKQQLLSVQTGGFGLRSSVAVSISNVYDGLRQAIFVFVTVLILGMAFVAAVVLGASYRFTKPLKQVAEGIAAFGQENLNARMDDFSIEEFHEISMVFNEMTERIQYLITQVYEKELLASQSQVRYLQSQMNPHFQFNILAMLGLRAKLAGCEEVYQGLHAFSKLMQGKIFREKRIKIPLREELEIVDFYLFLQNSRYAQKITYEIRYGSEEVKDDLVPKLLIEPLVENAVSHGLEPKETDGRILVEVREVGERLLIVVEDDGVGFDEEEAARTRRDAKEETDGIFHTHMGLVNTERLLHILYKDACEMKIQGRKGVGTRVEILLPIERSEGDV